MISFLSDYGTTDEFVGVVHGVVARIAPEVRVIDVTHGIAPGNIRAGALALTRALQYLPDGVVLAVVDPGVGGTRRAIAAATDRGYFVGPDNGLLAPAVALAGGAREIVALQAAEYRLPQPGATFAGRDVFAPAAAVLAAGEAELRDLGPSIDDGSVVPLLLPLVEQRDGAVYGEVLWEDRFGNLQTNISPDDAAAAGLEPGRAAALTIAGQDHVLPWEGTFADVEVGQGMLVTDSSGLLTIAVREGRAAARFSAGEGAAVQLRGAP